MLFLASKFNRKFVPLKYSLTISILLIYIPTVLILFGVDYHTSKKEFEQQYRILANQAEHNILDTVRFVNMSYQVIEKSLNDRLERGFIPFLKEYKKVKGDISKINLDLLKTKLGKGIDLYIINKKGIVEKTTYEIDQGLDFRKWPSFFKKLTKIRLGNQYVGDFIVTETLTGKLRKFGYLPTPDHQYILELGLVFEEFKPLLAELDMAKVSKKLNGFNPYLKSVTIFNHHGLVYGKPNEKVKIQKKALIKKVYNTKKGFSFQNKENLTETSYLFLDLEKESNASDMSSIIELIYDRSSVEKKLVTKQYTLVIVGIISMIGIILVTFVICAWLTKPINQIIDDIDVISKGNFHHKIRAKSNNELKILKYCIRKMVNGINGHIDQISSLNSAYSFFVPNDFFHLLEKNHIVDLKLGDQVQKEMTILFSDIRSFTQLSENMSPKENFDFINNYLGYIGTAIRENGGFIDKYIGDSIMALFINPDEAVQAAISIQQKLQVFNQEREALGQKGIKTGVGLHSGTLMLGIIGENQRMEATVISDAVNLASRIENLTKTYDLPVLISEDTYKLLQNPKLYSSRIIDYTNIRGKEKLVRLYEIFDGDEPHLYQKKDLIQKRFEEGVKLYEQAQFEKAKNTFQNCLLLHPLDKPTQIYLKRCSQESLQN
ncbi:MAG: class 3 adenylate cyclase/HAMP domain-containing protein [bacterium]|jgi:class 3 adenylate cyclase/HAMP domain-containing protein